jgi:hypothetical protein
VPRPFNVVATLVAGAGRDLLAPDTLEAADLLELLLVYVQLLGLLSRIDINLTDAIRGLLVYLDVTASSQLWMGLDCVLGGGFSGKAMGSSLIITLMPGARLGLGHCTVGASFLPPALPAARQWRRCGA